MLTRSELCILAAIDMERFKSMSRRGQLPFMGDDSTSEKTEVAGRRRYSPEDAVRLVLLDNLARRDGLPLDAAAKIIVNVGYLFGRRSYFIPEDPTQDLWIGIARTSYEEEIGKCIDGAFHVAGLLGDVLSKVQDQQTKFSDTVFRLDIVNFSDACRIVLRRARAHDDGGTLYGRVASLTQGS